MLLLLILQQVNTIFSVKLEQKALNMREKLYSQSMIEGV